MDVFSLSTERLESRLAMTAGAAATVLLPAYDIGTPSVVDIWVDPTAGSDARGGASRANAVPQETLKVNRCQCVSIENRDISGAWDNAVDFVAVHYGHVVGNRITARATPRRARPISPRAAGARTCPAVRSRSPTRTS